ncbi:MAG TPA: prepilin-type N-terminal cleavage/methylation domain-containing protein [Lacunisphaera sp.]|jgi:prepilin-type N-terminal cleavage/methylation domain-containing protein
MMIRLRPHAGFTLIEVVVAVALFAVAVTAMLGLLPSVTRVSDRSNDTMNALRLPDALRVELRRAAVVGGLDALGEQTKPFAAPLPETCLLVATRDASRVSALDYQPPASAEQVNADAQYFLIEAWRFSDPPLAFAPGDSVLALHIRVSWPYRIPGSLVLPPATEREHVDFNLALNR